ncbi:hypothetical protein HQ545_07960 [Candidatus Woesearchaeota archaeon]|nr:hypothetical protein [Candidatus Woesearchaeota archaeon]
MKAVKFMKTDAFNVLQKIKQNKFLFLLTMLLDIAFFVSLSILNKTIELLIPIPEGASPNKTIVLAIIVILLYITLTGLVYSLFKYRILQMIKGLYTKKNIKLGDFWNFFFINILLITASIITTFVVSSIFIISIELNALMLMKNLFLAILAVFLYLLINTIHTRFALGEHKIIPLILTSASMIFHKTRIYINIIIFTSIATILLGSVYYLISWLVLAVLGEAIKSPLVYISYTVITAIIIAFIALNVIAFNRIYFFELLRKKSKK